MLYILEIILLIILSIVYSLVNLPNKEQPGEIPKKKLGGKDEIKDLKKYPRSKTEARVIAILEELTGEKFPTVNPDWLVWRGKTLELDGYNQKLKLSIEFSGPLHTKWFPAVETYDKYYNRIVKDIVKKKICKRNGVFLIVIDASLPSVHWRGYLQSRLYDAGLGPAPVNYIAAQSIEPFRNKQLERELNIDQDIKQAKKL
jgi:hypothetical protein